MSSSGKKIRICTLCQVKIPGDISDWNRHVRGQRHRRNIALKNTLEDFYHQNPDKRESKSINNNNNNQKEGQIDEKTQLQIAMEMSINDQKEKESEDQKEIDLAIAMSINDKTQMEEREIELATAISLSDQSNMSDQEMLQYVLSQSIYEDMQVDSDLPNDEEDYMLDDDFDAFDF